MVVSVVSLHPLSRSVARSIKGATLAAHSPSRFSCIPFVPAKRPAVCANAALGALVRNATGTVNYTSFL